jgi:hypothetical protein
VVTELVDEQSISLTQVERLKTLFLLVAHNGIFQVACYSLLNTVPSINAALRSLVRVPDFNIKTSYILALADSSQHQFLARDTRRQEAFKCNKYRTKLVK